MSSLFVRLRKDYAYSVLMLFGAGLTIIKALGVSATLSSGDFSVYAATVAASIYIGGVIPFGLLQRTYKEYPRLAADGQHKTIVVTHKRILISVIFRGSGCTLFAILAGVYFDVESVKIVIGAVIAIMVAAGNLYSSLLRGTFNLLCMGKVALVRAATALSCSLTGAMFFGFYGALTGEAIGAAIGVCVSIYYSKQILARATNSQEGAGISDFSEQEDKAKSSDGLRVLFAGSLVSAPIYLDRLYVAGRLDSDGAGEYALGALFASIAMLICNTISQKVGPELVAMRQRGANRVQCLRLVLNSSAVSLAVWGGALLLLYTLWFFGVRPGYIASYELGLSFWLAVFFLGATFIYAFLEFMLLSFDLERQYLNNSVLYLLSVVLLFFFVGGPSTEASDYILWFACCRLFLIFMAVYRLVFPGVSYGK